MLSWLMYVSAVMMEENDRTWGKKVITDAAMILKIQLKDMLILEQEILMRKQHEYTLIKDY